jgi:hypothetical protein
MYRITGKYDFRKDVDRVQEIEPATRSIPPGRYDVDEMFHSRHTSRRWGAVIKEADGSVVIKPERWEK